MLGRRRERERERSCKDKRELYNTVYYLNNIGRKRGEQERERE
jgi:hypothetical protein